MIWLRVLGSIVSGIGLAFAFEPFGQAELVWFALVPAILGFRFSRSKREAAGQGFLCGLSCWMISLHWFLGMTESQDAGFLSILFGQFALSTWCTLFFLPLAIFTQAWFAHVDGRRLGANVAFVFAAACVWIGSEWLRSVLFTGFAWNTLAITQYENLSLIQIASLGGVYAVSFVIISLNLGFATTIQRYIVRTGKRLTWHPEVMLPMGLLAASLSFGIIQLRKQEHRAARAKTISAVLVQPNISQYEKFDTAFARQILETLYTTTLDAFKTNPSDLVVWPETAFPDHWKFEAVGISKLLSEIDAPLLSGGLHYTIEDLRQAEFYNGSFLFETGQVGWVQDPEGSPPPRYNKQHLVMFGESVPFRKQLPFLTKLTPVQYYCLPGRESTIFTVKGIEMSPLICFEDVMPYLARRAVRNGARVLINQTNDAWFDPYLASEQHRPHAVFRCVEHRVPMLRCTNTGRSCVIDASGRVIMELPLQLTTWGRVPDLAVPERGQPPTLYTRIGDLPAILAGALGLILCLVLCRKPAADKEG